MLDPKLEADLTQEILRELGFSGATVETWVKQNITAKISIVITRVYQEGMRDAFLAMGSYIKK